MKQMSLPFRLATRRGRSSQQGVVLFFALIALLVMSLAAVALIRSVDTNTLIAGNLAFKQSSTASGDEGTEAAFNWLDTQKAAMNAQNIATDNPAHTFNTDQPGLGYYSSARPASDLTDGTFNWNNGIPAKVDGGGNAVANASGNTVMYVIERMCRVANQIPSASNCLYYSENTMFDPQNVKSTGQTCNGGNCTPSEGTPQVRITARVSDNQNNTSYIQTFLY